MALTISYREVGSGFPVVCLHASAGSPGQWRALMTRLGRRYRVIAPSRIGYGGNAPWPTDRPARLQAEVAALAPLLDQIGPSFALIGHSFGGAVALKVALMYPERVRALAVFEPAIFSPILRQRAHDADTIRFIALGDAICRAVEEGDLASAARRFVDFWHMPGAWDATPVERRGAIQEAVRQLPAEWQCSLGEPRLLGEVAGLDVPTLYLTGTTSPRPAREVAALLAPALPQGELIELDGVGHMGPITHPDRVNGAIGQFLDRTLGERYERAA